MATLHPQVLSALADASVSLPFDVLGLQKVEVDGTAAIAIRALVPGARAVEVLRERTPGDGSAHGGVPHPMDLLHAGGVFEAVFPGESTSFAYRLRITAADGTVTVEDDPYRFPPRLSENDLRDFLEKSDVRLYERLGAHELVHEGVSGVDFAVWAPNAERVSVIGSFNRWDARRHMMQPRGHSGVWEIFIPAVERGALYKYALRTKLPGHPQSDKADPCGFFMERRPNTASIVWDSYDYTWGDAAWMQERARRQSSDRPLLIYEVHLGSWRRLPQASGAPAAAAPAAVGFGPGVSASASEASTPPTRAASPIDPASGSWLTYRELAEQLVPYAKEMGYTHLELLPITEHPFDGSWGYQTVGYYAPTSRFGPPDDFRWFVDAAHQAGLGVILDWVPAHFPRDGHGLAFFDGTHLYEHADPRQGLHQDWGTFIFNFGRHTVCSFLLSNALYWLSRFHIDGLRVDAVASMLYLDYSRKPGEWIPNKLGGRENLEAMAFLQEFNALVHRECPGVLTFAEESTAWPKVSHPVSEGGLGFDYKWNMGWMNDVLRVMRTPPPQRPQLHDRLTFSMMYAFSERFVLSLSHDEVVHGKRSLLSKMPGSYEEKFANLRLLYGWMAAHPGKKLLFMGGELGQFIEWSHDRQLDWLLLDFPLHRAMQLYVRELNQFYQSQPALWENDGDWKGFQWIEADDAARSVLSFVRRGKDPRSQLVAIANFQTRRHDSFVVGVPQAGSWAEAFNSDRVDYGGSGAGNPQPLPARPEPAQGQPFAISLVLPSLSIVFLQRTAD